MLGAKMSKKGGTEAKPDVPAPQESVHEAGGSTVGVKMSWLPAIAMASFTERGWGLEETGPHPGGNRSREGQLEGGRITLSMTWMTPFEAITSGVTTLALSFR